MMREEIDACKECQESFQKIKGSWDKLTNEYLKVVKERDELKQELAKKNLMHLEYMGSGDMGRYDPYTDSFVKGE